jgi:hypothetical protein
MGLLIAMNRKINYITLFASIFLAFLVSVYLFTPMLDQWAIEKSMTRYCSTVKEEFSGQFYSPAYLCTFIEGIE